VNTKSDTLDISGPLAESMDQSIGEVTTVMGAMITELMRRSLRGGVVKIGEELQSVVLDKVDTAVAQRVPEVERAASAAAEQTAQLTAAKVAAEEVYALDRKTGDAARQLASQIEEVGRKAHGAVEEKAQALTGRIDEVDRRAHGAVEEKAQALTGRIDEVDRRAVETTRQTAEQLSGRIVETEKRVTETTQAEIDQRLLKVMEKSREAAAVLKTRIKAVEDLSEGLGQQLRQGLDRLGQSLSQGVESCQARLKDEVSALRKVNEALEARVKALEQPKGFFAFIARLFGRRKGKGKEKEIGVAGA
jgi:uncharacterized phage infection (PIP) family protein YhgE